MVAVTSIFGVAEPSRITLFGAGTSFLAALLVTDPRRRDRVRTLGWAAVVVAVAVVVTINVRQIAVWAVAALLVVLMFLSFALRSRSPRAGSVAAIGALTTLMASAGHITMDRIGWFVLASTVGIGWLAVWQLLILPDDPVRSLTRSVHAFCRRAAEAVANVADALTTTCDRNTPDRALKALRHSLDRVRSCRTVIDTELTGALVPHGSGRHDIEQLRVALYCTQRGLEQMADSAHETGWITTVPDELAGSITSTLQTLAAALRNDVDTPSMETVAADAEKLRDHIHAMTVAANADQPAHLPSKTALAALTTIAGAELVAQSITQAQASPTATPERPGAAAPEGDAATARAAGSDSSPQRRTLQPTMALALQSAVAAVAAGLIAKALGNTQSLVVAWTAFATIAGSAGASTRRAWSRLVATILGATGGVVIAATVPHNIVWAVAVVTTGVFFTIFSAPVSYAAMVFWLSIVFVSLFTTEGPYLDLVRDKAVGALIGGCVAAAVALTIAPIRLSRDFRPAVLQYLDALDKALESHLPGQSDRKAKTAESELDRAHAALDSIAASAAAEIHLFPQPGSPLSEQAVRIDSVHEAFVSLTPLLSDSSRRLLGWTDEQTEIGIGQLRNDVDTVKAAATGDPAPDNRSAPSHQQARLANPSTNNPGLALDDALWRSANLHARLTELAEVLGDHPTSPVSVN